MQERHSQFSRDALSDFLDFVGEKGLLKKSTARVRKIATNAILGSLDDNESSDLSKIDVESAIQRHRNLATGKITPRTLAAYESRTRTALRDFLEYVKAPASWKPGTKQRTTRATPKAKKSDNSKQNSKSKEIITQTDTSLQPSVHIDLQIHISPEADSKQIDQIFASMRRHLYGNRTE